MRSEGIRATPMALTSVAIVAATSRRPSSVGASAIGQAGWDETCEHRHAGCGDAHTNCAARSGEQHTFGSHLA
jgi:hypothetical protein